MVSIYKRNDWWHGTYRIGGQRIRVALNTKSAAEAKKWKRRQEARVVLDQAAAPRTPPFTRRSRLSGSSGKCVRGRIEA